MIRDITQRTRVKLLAEFDAMFPDASAPTENPTTYREVLVEGRRLKKEEIERKEEQQKWII